MGKKKDHHARSLVAAPGIRKRLRLGDIIEIPLSKRRFAYGQLIYNYKRPPVWGTLFRIFGRIFTQPQENFEELVKEEEQFMTFYPGARAVNLRLIRIVGNEPIPQRLRKFPLFKADNTNFHTGKKTWFLWDGKRETFLGDLPARYVNLPICQIIGHQLLVERIKKGWTHADIDSELS